MTGRRARVAAIVAVCAGVLLLGSAAVVFLAPRAAPILSRAFSFSAPSRIGQPELEALLQRVAKRLDPALQAKLAEAVLTESERAGYDPLFILALVSVESGFRPHVARERGAYGLMQLKPSTFASIAGRNPDLGDGGAVSEDPVVDVRLAIRYFHWLERRVPRPGEAPMAYNARPRRLRPHKRARTSPAGRAHPPQGVRA